MDAALEAASDVSLVVAVKPLPETFGVGLQATARNGTPLLLDVDDPQWAIVDRKRPRGRAALRHLLYRRATARLHQRMKDVPRMVSNPVLQQRLGGTIVPHVRERRGAGKAHGEPTLRVAFIGTTRRHKGVQRLRAAIENLQDIQATLIITDHEPADVRPWERWVGLTTLEKGLTLVDAADVVALPSEDDAVGQAQLPVKLIDAMISGRGIVASDVPPMRWALGDAALFVRPGSVTDLVHALRKMRDPAVRQDLGHAARERGLALFTPPAGAEALAAASAACSLPTATT